MDHAESAGGEGEEGIDRGFQRMGVLLDLGEEQASLERGEEGDGEVVTVRWRWRSRHRPASPGFARWSAPDDDDPDLLKTIKSAPGPVSLASMLTEPGKLAVIGSFELPEGLFRDVAPRVLKEWRDQAMTESPSYMRECPPFTGHIAAVSPPGTSFFRPWRA